MIGMLVAAIFLNRMRWELWYILSAYVVSLRNSVGVDAGPSPNKIM